MKIFDIDGRFFNLISKIINVIIVNMMFVICSFPIITIGAATTALYSVTLKMARDQEGYIVRDFLSSFKDNFKQATIIWLGMLVSFVVLITDINVLNVMIQWQWMMIPIYMIIFLIIILMLFTFPLLAQFTATIKQTLKNAVFMELANLPALFLIIFIHALPFFLTVTQPIAIEITFLIWGGFGFSAVALLCSYIYVYKVFPKYMDPLSKTDDSKL